MTAEAFNCEKPAVIDRRYNELECGDFSPLFAAATRGGDTTTDKSAVQKSGSELPHSKSRHRALTESGAHGERFNTGENSPDTHRAVSTRGEKMRRALAVFLLGLPYCPAGLSSQYMVKPDNSLG